MYACIHACMYVCIHTYIHTCIYTCEHFVHRICGKYWGGSLVAGSTTSRDRNLSKRCNEARPNFRFTNLGAYVHVYVTCIAYTMFTQEARVREYIHVHMYVYTYISMYRMYVCRYVRMCVCMTACMYVCVYVSMYACMYVCMHVCMYGCMYVCVPVCITYGTHIVCTYVSMSHAQWALARLSNDKTLAVWQGKRALAPTRQTSSVQTLDLNDYAKAGLAY